MTKHNIKTMNINSAGILFHVNYVHFILSNTSYFRGGTTKFAARILDDIIDE